MAKLTVAILGLDRLGASIALRLQTYVEKGGQHRFELIGYDSREDFEKPARKLKVFDKVERKAYAAVESADLVIMNLPFEDLRAGYELVASSLREGVVILDTAVIKQPSLRWAAEFLSEDHHVIGFTPVVNAEFMLEHPLTPEHAADDYFHDSQIYLTPAVNSIREAIDLAVNFSLILDGKPHFLDPAEHDSLTTITEEIPQVLSIAAYSAAMKHNAWGDAQRLTNPPFNVLTRYLLTHHPDALRDEWLENSDALVRAIDEFLLTLRQVRDRLAEGDESAIEAFLIDASDDYQEWINKRHKGDWDDQPSARVQYDTSIAGTLFGSAIGKRLFGGNKDGDR
ncbi:MAG: prephenate dehydrogenase/arogenate dehydrogenase family protein [Chloroflexi bacterium]|nr:prephenate dehydrogenase/arogenate dehydrogenase family protein [Chloroflexota bacterium]